jgi:(4S)-4-hydroxy-5-phosphonooxypentane-2,3-dione isomerase
MMAIAGSATRASGASRNPAYKSLISSYLPLPLWAGSAESGSTEADLPERADCMHIVLVLVTVRPELLEEFERALLHNARESVARDPGCIRFDVSQQQDDPTRWLLYEVYDSPDAHAAHRRSPHFLAYDAVATRALVDKTVIRASGKYLV